MTFYKDTLTVVILCVILSLHLVTHLCDLCIKNEKWAKITATCAVFVNIILHLLLILSMMNARLMLDEAVLVVMISIFFFTLVFFARYEVSSFLLRHARAENAGGDEE